MAEFTWRPTVGAQADTEPRLLEAKFGDGYVQAVPNGINFMPETWDLTFNNLTDATALAIDTFLRAQGGYITFDWKTPRGVLLKFRCKRWSTVYKEEDQSTVTATFVQVFG